MSKRTLCYVACLATTLKWELPRASFGMYYFSIFFFSIVFHLAVIQVRFCTCEHEYIYILLFSIMSTVNLEPSGVLQLCPGSNITFVCTNNQTGVLAWRSFEQDYPEGHPYFFNQGSEVDMVERVSRSFAVVSLSASPLISTATLRNNFGLQLKGTNLTCSSTTKMKPPPSKLEYAVLILKGN